MGVHTTDPMAPSRHERGAVAICAVVNIRVIIRAVNGGDVEIAVSASPLRRRPWEKLIGPVRIGLHGPIGFAHNLKLPGPLLLGTIWKLPMKHDLTFSAYGFVERAPLSFKTIRVPKQGGGG